MKRVIDVVPIDFKTRDDQYTPFSVTLQEPGRVRMVTTVVKEPSSIIQTELGKPAEAALVPVPALVVESDPDGETRKRSFVWLAPGVKLTLPMNLEFRATYIDELTRNPMFLYEVFPDKKGT